MDTLKTNVRYFIFLNEVVGEEAMKEVSSWPPVSNLPHPSKIMQDEKQIIHLTPRRQELDLSKAWVYFLN